MYRARSSCLLLLLLFLIIPALTHADSILTFREDNSRFSAPLSGSWTSVLENTNSIVDLRSQSPPVKFTSARVNLTLTYLQTSAKYKKVKFKSRQNGQDNDDQGEDEDEEEDGGGHHAKPVPEPPMAATLVVGLALLLFKLRRSR